MFPASPAPRALLVVCLLALAALTGCKKKTWQPYYQLDAQQQILLARDGEDAYASEELDGIITALRAAPAGVREYDQAIALANKLSTEQTRVKAELEARQLAASQKPPPPVFPTPSVNTAPPPPTPAPAEPATATDAGEEEPYAGMSEADFLKRWGACFTPGPATTGPDGGAATQQYVKKNDASCARWGPPANENRYIFYVKSGYWGWFTRPPAVVVTETGAPPAPKPSALADAGERIITIPGAPVREGYRRELDGYDAGPPPTY